MKTLEQKFWERVERRGDSECWPWLGEKNSTGYGRIATGGRGRRVRVFAHHISLQIHGVNGEGCVMHSCDNPNCVNPKHMSFGTQQENLASMRKKLRHNIGERNGMAKLTNVSVAEIRTQLKMGLKLQAIADCHGVAKSTIRNIKSGRRWALVNTNG